MDPLSITAAVASLLKLTASIALELKKFHDDAKEVDKTLKILLRDVERFDVVLHSMRDTFAVITAQQTTTGFAGALWGNVAQSLQDGVRVMQEFDVKLQDINKERRFLNHARKQLRLNFAGDDIDAFRLQVGSFRDCLSLSMSAIIIHNQIFIPMATQPAVQPPDLSQLEHDIRRIANEMNSKIQALQSSPSDQIVANRSDQASGGALTGPSGSVQDAGSVQMVASGQDNSPAQSQTPASSGSQVVPVMTANSVPVSNEDVQEAKSSNEIASGAELPKLPSLQRTASLATRRTKSIDEIIQTTNSRIVVLSNLRNCVQASADIVSTASSMAASEQAKDNASVIGGSDFGDCFPPVASLTMMRWLDTATIDEEAELGARPDSAADSTGSDGKVIDSDPEEDLDDALAAALLGAAKKELERGEDITAEKMFKDCVTRTARDASASSQSKQKLSDTVHIAAVNHLYRLYERQARWLDAKDCWSQILNHKQRSAGIGFVQATNDLLVLARLMQLAGEIVECRLYARQALQACKRARNTAEEQECLHFLVQTYDSADTEYAAYSFMLDNVMAKRMDSIRLSKSATELGSSKPDITRPSRSQTPQTSQALTYVRLAYASQGLQGQPSVDAKKEAAGPPAQLAQSVTRGEEDFKSPIQLSRTVSAAYQDEIFDPANPRSGPRSATQSISPAIPEATRVPPSSVDERLRELDSNREASLSYYQTLASLRAHGASPQDGQYPCLKPDCNERFHDYRQYEEHCKNAHLIILRQPSSTRSTASKHIQAGLTHGTTSRSLPQHKSKSSATGSKASKRLQAESYFDVNHELLTHDAKSSKTGSKSIAAVSACPVIDCPFYSSSEAARYLHVQQKHQPGWFASLKVYDQGRAVDTNETQKLLERLSARKGTIDRRRIKHKWVPIPEGSSERRHIAFVGCAGAGKSSLISYVACS